METLLALLLGLSLVGAGLWDAFETVVLPRRVSRRVRIASVFYRLTWRPYAAIASRVRDEPSREAYLSFYGPLSLILLVGVWALVLVLGFGVLQWAAGSSLTATDAQTDFGFDLYFSGTTFFTLGLGDVVPRSALARVLTVVEAGTGFGFLALVIGYLPIVYQMFARRETNVSLLDQRAGSPPSAAELLRRNIDSGDVTVLIQLLHDWEIWVADLLESHLSYPTLAYFRSQHENQSWVAALAVILDVSAYLLACGAGRATRQAAFTFAVGRHAVGDLSHVFGVEPRAASTERLGPEAARRLREIVRERGLAGTPNAVAATQLTAIRGAYEPYLEALSTHLLMPLPPWTPAPGAMDNWETTSWDFESPVALFGPESPFRTPSP
jgi:ion channel